MEQTRGRRVGWWLSNLCGWLNICFYMSSWSGGTAQPQYVQHAYDAFGAILCFSLHEEKLLKLQQPLLTGLSSFLFFVTTKPRPQSLLLSPQRTLISYILTGWKQFKLELHKMEKSRNLHKSAGSPRYALLKCHFKSKTFFFFPHGRERQNFKKLIIYCCRRITLSDIRIIVKESKH